MVKNIKKYTNELINQNEQIEISQNLLLNYYNLITNNITDINTTIYILHLLFFILGVNHEIFTKSYFKGFHVTTDYG